MAVPVPQPPHPATGPSRRGFHLPARQPYARETERRAHEEALFAFGEYALFVLLWQLQDFQAGRVGRCSRCQTGTGTGSTSKDAAIFDVFKQAPEDRCPNCYGTTFEGGWKAKLVRPSTWDYREEKWDKQNRGYVTNLNGQVQSTSDFRLADRDIIMRADGTRWRASGASTDRLHDGFGMPSRIDSNMGYNYGSVVREDESSVAFEITPKTRTELTTLLDSVGNHYPIDTSAVDQIRGPILIEMNEFSPADYRPVDEIPGPPEGEP